MRAQSEPRRLHRQRERTGRRREEDRAYHRRRSPERKDRRTSADKRLHHHSYLRDRKKSLEESRNKYFKNRVREKADKRESQSASKAEEKYRRSSRDDRREDIRKLNNTDSGNQTLIDIPLPQGPNCCLVDMDFSSTDDQLSSPQESSPKRQLSSPKGRLDMEFGVASLLPPKLKKGVSKSLFKEMKHMETRPHTVSEVTDPTTFKPETEMLLSPPSSTMKDTFIPLPAYALLPTVRQGILMPVKPFSISMPNTVAYKNDNKIHLGSRMLCPIELNESLTPTVCKNIPVSETNDIDNVLTPQSGLSLDKPQIQFNDAPDFIQERNTGQGFNLSPKRQSMSNPLHRANTNMELNPQLSSPITSPLHPNLIPEPRGGGGHFPGLHRPISIADRDEKPTYQKCLFEPAKILEGTEETAPLILEKMLKVAKEADVKRKKVREIMKRDREIREREMEQMRFKKSKIHAKLPKEGIIQLHTKSTSKPILKPRSQSTARKPSSMKKEIILKRVPGKKKRVVFADGIRPGDECLDAKLSVPLSKNSNTFILPLLPPPPPPPVPPPPPPGSPPPHLVLSAILNPAPGHMWVPHTPPPSRVVLRLVAYHRAMLAARQELNGNTARQIQHGNYASVVGYLQPIYHQGSVQFIYPLGNEYCWT